MTVVQYTLTDIETIISKGIPYTLDESTVAILQNISTQVGSPEYVKTPTFKKKEHSVSKTSRNKNHKNHENWDMIRNHKPSKRDTLDGVARSIDVIRKTLNKITSKTYECLYPTIMEELDKVVQSENSELEPLGTTIFSIVSETAFFSEMYAELYSKLYMKYEFVRKALVETLTSFEENTKTIPYCNPEEDYDEFCKNNKENARRKSVAVFLVNLSKYQIVDVLDICTIINNIQNRILSLIKTDNNNEMVDELSEISGDMIITGKCKLNSCNVWDTIVSNVNLISKMKPKEHASLTNKTMFKHMDILDHIYK